MSSMGEAIFSFKYVTFVVDGLVDYNNGDASYRVLYKQRRTNVTTVKLNTVKQGLIPR